jgi:hypothetical protein
MCGAILPHPQYAFMAWCSVKKITGTTLPLTEQLSAFQESPCTMELVMKVRMCKEDNIKIDTEEIGCEVVDWIHMAQDRVQWQSCAEAKEISNSRGRGLSE